MKPEKNDATLTKNQPAAAKDDYREPTKEELLADLRVALREAIVGVPGRPALELLDEIERETAIDANAR